MIFRLPRVLGLSFVCVLVTMANAQPRPPVPTLTTDDILGSKPAMPAPPPATDLKKDEKVSPPAAASTTPAKTEDDPKKKAEKEWNERLKAAQEKADDLARRADQAELQITQLRNQLMSATTRAPEANGKLNTVLNDLTQRRDQLRAEAQRAQQDVNALQAEGQQNSYQVAGVSLANDKGEPDAKAYQTEYARFQSELRDAQARVEVLQLRLSNIQAEVLKRGNGDNFTLNRLRQEREQTTTELRDTQTKIETLKTDLNKHRQKANETGVKLP